MDELTLDPNAPTEPVQLFNAQGEVHNPPEGTRDPRLDLPILELETFDEMAVSIINYFNDPQFPEALITSLVYTETLEATDDAGRFYQTEITARLSKRPEWFTQIGFMSKVIAENLGNQFPRKLSLGLAHTQECLVLRLRVDSYGIVVSAIDLAREKSGRKRKKRLEMKKLG